MEGSGRQAFTADAAAYFERLGLSRPAARVMGWLLLTDEQGADASELCEGLGTSKSGVSVAIGQLELSGLVERIRMPGQRRERYRLTEDVFGNAFRSSMASFAQFRDVADRGLALTGGNAVQRQRLERMRDMYAFMAEQFPRLLDEWEASR